MQPAHFTEHLPEDRGLSVFGERAAVFTMPQSSNAQTGCSLHRIAITCAVSRTPMVCVRATFRVALHSSSTGQHELQVTVYYDVNGVPVQPGTAGAEQPGDRGDAHEPPEPAATER